MSTKHMRGPGAVPKELEDTYNRLTEDQRRHLLTRGLLAHPPVEFPQSPQDTMSWTIYPEDGVLQSGWIVYLDGSFRDGPSEIIGRTGFSFIAYDGEWRVRAAACGVPPPWIKSIHGAELWALFAAARLALPGVAFRTDRKAVLDIFQAGRKEATASSVELAHLWAAVFDAFDDYEDPSASVDLAWMPAHTTAADVGVARLSNGEFLTARDRAANDAADHLAKRGAQTHRVPAWLRKKVKKYELLAGWAARTLGIATHAANNLVVPGCEVLQRDSTGQPAWKRKAKAQPPSDVATVEAAGVPPPVAAPAEAGAPEKAVKRRNSSDDSASASDSDFCAEQPPQSARACRAKQRRLSRERFQLLVRSTARWSYPDEGEATAPNRVRHLRQRVLNNERASRSSTAAQAPLPALGTASQAASAPSTPSQSQVPGPPQAPCLQSLLSRPVRSGGVSRSTEQRATSAAISSLLS